MTDFSFFPKRIPNTSDMFPDHFRLKIRLKSNRIRIESGPNRPALLNTEPATWFVATLRSAISRSIQALRVRKSDSTPPAKALQSVPIEALETLGDN